MLGRDQRPRLGCYLGPLPIRTLPSFVDATRRLPKEASMATIFTQYSTAIGSSTDENRFDDEERTYAAPSAPPPAWLREKFAARRRKPS